MRDWLRDLNRIGALLVIALVLIIASPFVARWLDEPALAGIGLSVGWVIGLAAFSHITRRILFSYVGMREFSKAAVQSPVGAGLVFLGVCLVLAVLMLCGATLARAGDLPPNAVTYLPALKAEQQKFWGDMSMPSALGAQVEQETCISLKSRSCWSPHAELKTSREYGFGLGQITITKDFDNFKGAQRLDMSLRDWAFADRYDPARQLRTLILMDLVEYRYIVNTRTENDRLAMMFSSYNGGRGGLIKERQMCRGTVGCDSATWWGNVERTSNKSRVKVGGYGQSFFDINREYPRNILGLRRPKYVPFFGK